MKKLFLLLFSFGLVALFLGVAVHERAALADTAPSAAASLLNGITYPVAELGNCASRDECRAYCDQTQNIAACITFAKAHGLTTSEDAIKAQKFAQILQSGGGPGGCTTPEACQTFCSNIQNISVCVSFAKQNGFSDDNISEAEKIQQYLQGGGTMPGGCASKDSCEEYCSDFAHADECQAFAQKVGITEIENAGQQKIPSGQFQKLLELIKEHKTPGQCTSADSCEEYCKDSAHQTECIAFAKEAGFVTSDQADKIEKLGGKGPGGCDSEDSCKAYCNDPAHQIACLQFAQTNGLVSQDEAKSAQNALVRLREGISDAPDAVQQCLSSTLGQQTINEIEAGTFTPSPALGQQVSACFQNSGEEDNPSDALKNLPSDVASCIENKVGSALQQVQQGKEEPTPEIADAVHACMQMHEINNEKDHTPQAMQQMMQQALQNAPQDVRTCLQNHQQDISSQTDASKLQETINKCLEDFQPKSEMPSLPGKETNDIQKEQNGSQGDHGSASSESEQMQQMMQQQAQESEGSGSNSSQ